MLVPRLFFQPSGGGAGVPSAGVSRDSLANSPAPPPLPSSVDPGAVSGSSAPLGAPPPPGYAAPSPYAPSFGSSSVHPHPCSPTPAGQVAYTDYYYYYYGKHSQGHLPNPEAFRASQQNHTAPGGGVGLLQSNLQNNPVPSNAGNFGGAPPSAVPSPLQLSMAGGSAQNAVLSASQPSLAHQGGQSGGVIAYGSTPPAQVGSDFGGRGGSGGGGCDPMAKARFDAAGASQQALNVSEQGG